MLEIIARTLPDPSVDRWFAPGGAYTAIHPLQTPRRLGDRYPSLQTTRYKNVQRYLCENGFSPLVTFHLYPSGSCAHLSSKKRSQTGPRCGRVVEFRDPVLCIQKATWWYYVLILGGDSGGCVRYQTLIQTIRDDSHECPKCPSNFFVLNHLRS